MSLLGPPNVARLEAKGDVKGLLKALGDSSAGQAAAKALARIGAAPEPLIAALNDRAEVRRGNAWQALQELGPPAVPAVATALMSGTPEVRRIAARILGKIGDPKAIIPLAAALLDEDYYVRDWAGASLAAYTAPVVAAALKDQSEDVRRVAAEAIAKSAENEARGVADAKAILARRAAAQAADAVRLTSAGAPDSVPSVSEARQSILHVLQSGATESQKRQDIWLVLRSRLVDQVGSGKVHFCECGYPTSITQTDGSYGQLWGLLDGRSVGEYSSAMHCPSCGKFVLIETL